MSLALKEVIIKPKKLFYGWRVVGALAIVNALGGGLVFYGFSVFFLPVSRDLNLSRAATSLIFSLSRAEGALEGPAAGWLIDKYGPRIVVFLGAIMAGVGYILVSQADSYLSFLLLYMGVVTIGYQAAFVHAPLATANNWFVRRRGLAMGVVMTGFGAGGAFIVPLLGIGVSQIGWRSIMFIAGLLILAVVLPVSIIIKRSPESMGLRPDGDAVPVEATPTSHGSAALSGFNVRQAMATPVFWLLVAAITLRVATYGALMVHFIPIMVWKGVSEEWAAGLLGILSFLSIPARLGFGWLGDRWSKSKIIAVVVGAGVVSLLLLLYGQAQWQFWLFIVIFAAVEGMAPVNWSLVGEYFGRRFFATLRGIIGVFQGSGMAALPVLAGWLFDRSQSYEQALLTFAAFFVLSSLLFAILRPLKQTNGP